MSIIIVLANHPSVADLDRVTQIIMDRYRSALRTGILKMLNINSKDLRQVVMIMIVCCPYLLLLLFYCILYYYILFVCFSVLTLRV